MVHSSQLETTNYSNDLFHAKNRGDRKGINRAKKEGKTDVWISKLANQQINK